MFSRSLSANDIMGKISLLVLALIGLSSPIIFAQANSPAAKKAEPNPLLAPATEQLNEFALELYGRLLPEHQNQNFCFSPYGLYSVLGMATLGAQGATQDELCLALNWKADAKARPQPHVYAALREHLSLAVKQKDQANNGVELQMLNRLWFQSKVPLQQQFLNDCDQYFASDGVGLDFRANPKAAVKTVNQWFEQQSKGRFQTMLREDEASHVRFLLTNTVDFRAKWDLPFEKNNTRERQFYPELGEPSKRVTMNTESVFPYGEDRNVQVIRLPYGGGRFSMLLVLPRQRDGLAKLERNFNAKVFAKWNKELNSHQVKLFLPRFQVHHQQEFQAPLGTLGIKTAWHQQKAGFSAIIPAQKSAKKSPLDNLYLQFVRQKVAIDVSEEGTEAVALTIGAGGGFFGGGGLVQPPKPAIMDLNHPFLYAIREDDSGALIFLGRVANPQTTAGK